MKQSSSESRSERAPEQARDALISAHSIVPAARRAGRSLVVGATFAWGLVAVQPVFAAAPVSVHSERVVAVTHASAESSFKSNPDTKSAAVQAKAARADKKKAARAARMSQKKNDHDSTKVAKADKKRASDESIGTSDDPLEGL